MKILFTPDLEILVDVPGEADEEIAIAAATERAHAYLSTLIGEGADVRVNYAGTDSLQDAEVLDCNGHESLAGEHMGETVYCDGSCR